MRRPGAIPEWCGGHCVPLVTTVQPTYVSAYIEELTLERNAMRRLQPCR
jgi:hypothetical protein